ncbi:diaminopimelate decarboxylase [Enhygromyxa salina]|uniref:Diaminopimelate decarboxylase n=1 Tax=Enhygromyxa salina TaxID=215803 RepID=A0A2S9YL18_9BACT|nr:diaminopimelate decarboxylase [Enhygromyxa salina]PRQ05726.1 Diaminopimelate decarboxylase [Enhygromyxa salina]
MSILPASLLSDNASIAADGRLQIAGLDAVELAERFGTPLFVYDEDHIRARCRAARAAFPDGVAYASKAFLCRAVAKLAHEEGMQIDVASGGEMHVALAAGVPADSLVFHGNNKSEAELRYAMREGVHRIVVDSFDELDRIEALVAEGLPAPAILLRITPGVVAHTHEFVQTGQHDSKFGFGVESGVAQAAIERASASPAMRLLGLHAHVGSQVFDVSSFEKVIEVLAPIFNPLGLEELCIGGGLGVAYVEGESSSDILDWGAAIRRACAAQGITGRITAEPGRSIVAAAGLTLYRVGTIKRIPNVRTYVAVDGGMSDNPRPVLYGSGYETFLPRATSAERPMTIRLVGKHCESGDLLVRDGLVPSDLAVGDIIATPVTGAYGYSLGSNYNKVPRPAVVFVKDGEAREVIRRETWDDLLRLDL